MAISPQELIKLTPEQENSLAGLEDRIDEALKKNFTPGLEFEFDIEQKLGKAEIYHLEKSYERAGWDAVVEEYKDGTSKLILNYDEEEPAPETKGIKEQLLNSPIDYDAISRIAEERGLIVSARIQRIFLYDKIKTYADLVAYIDDNPPMGKGFGPACANVLSLHLNDLGIKIPVGLYKSGTSKR